MSESATIRPVAKVNTAALARSHSPMLPSLFVHAEHEEPQDLRCCPDQAKGCNVEEQTGSERDSRLLLCAPDQ
jgi:hypothetical protein